VNSDGGPGGLRRRCRAGRGSVEARNAAGAPLSRAALKTSPPPDRRPLTATLRRSLDYHATAAAAVISVQRQSARSQTPTETGVGH